MNTLTLKLSGQIVQDGLTVKMLNVNYLNQNFKLAFYKTIDIWSKI